jgi:ssDNA-binding replication factor A large subunit
MSEALVLDYNKMIEIVLEEKQELNFEKLKEMIEEKKRKVGAGYLTDQGALFLVAADIGVSLDKANKTESSIKDLFIGARDVSTMGRILAIHPTRAFLKRDSNQETKNRIITIYDKDSSIKIKLWDEFVTIPEQLGITTGDLIKISKGQVKSGMDGKPIINLSGGGLLEIVTDERKHNIPTIEEITITIDALDSPKENLVIIGNIKSDPRISEFTNIRGEHSKSLQFETTNDDYSRQIRTIIWNITEEKIPKSLTTDLKIKLIGVKTKIGNPNYGNGDLEIHGDEGTTIEFVDHNESIDSYILRIISFNKNNSEGKISCITVDENEKFYHLNINKDLFDIEINEDDIIECFPSRILGNTIEISSQDSYIQVLNEDKNIPLSSSLETKIKNVEMSNKVYFIEAIILQSPNTMDINTKSGETIQVTDTIIGDDTGEIRLVAWRETNNLLKTFKIGERIKIKAVSVTSNKEGKLELTLKPYSNISKIN